MRRRLAMVAVAIALCGAGIDRAAQYAFIFEKASGQFVPELADNRTTLAALHSLLEDYATARGLQFVLVGELPADCPATSDCPGAILLRQRAQAITSQLMLQPDGATLVAMLQWRAVPPATAHIEGLRLRVQPVTPTDFSDRCPYQLEVTDPRLPSLLTAGDDNQGWVGIQGLAAIPITEGAAIRVRAAHPAFSSATIVASESLSDHDVELISGPLQVQWSAEQLEWSDDGADVVIEGGAQPRDIGNVILPWNGDSGRQADNTTSTKGCRLHFVLSRWRAS